MRRRVKSRPQGGEQWYTNRDLLEMFQGLKDDLRTTMAAIKEYNGLRGLVNEVMQEMAEIKSAQLERYKVGKSIREWGGWIFGIASFCFSVWVYFRR